MLCNDILDAFDDEYLRLLITKDCQYMLNMYKTQHNFLNILISVNCMHWEWKIHPSIRRLNYTTSRGTYLDNFIDAVVELEACEFGMHF